ncbi:alpha/beta fold hydrolase [Niabella yanshanensis]|uniref:Alpha/beta fold hydrolase n=1 Tax=Niabella yanshanensis TaxID=577386 RepID=A0ABZ0W2L7_9BACT|nr:alpha/beta fold hydrolase [Niabella yanshanensis]WQD36341.1 alpha/beta fold hydrolase [Niabella yanshanensis]
MKKIIYGLPGIYIIVMMGLVMFQQKLIFRPEKLDAAYRFSFDQPFKELNFKSSDGALLNALYFTVPDPKGAILYFHGNKGSLRRWGVIASAFTKYGYNVLVMDYRGYGKSTGDMSELSLQNDARFFYKELQQQFPEDQIIVYGRSLGTHFAALVASENKPQRLILESPFTSIMDVAQARFPILPVKYFLKFPFNSSQCIEKLSCPLTIFHGTADKVVPYRLGRQLFEQAAGTNKALITINAGAHNNLAEFKEYGVEMERVLGRVVLEQGE